MFDGPATTTDARSTSLRDGEIMVYGDAGDLNTGMLISDDFPYRLLSGAGRMIYLSNAMYANAREVYDILSEEFRDVRHTSEALFRVVDALTAAHCRGYRQI